MSAHGSIVFRLGFLVGLIATSVTASAQLLGVDTVGTVYHVSTLDASLSVAGTTGIAGLGDFELGPDGGYYGFIDGSIPTLYRFDPATFAPTVIGPLGLPFVFEGALAFAPNGTAYATNGGSDVAAQLLTINLATGTATVVATISGGTRDINGLTWRSDGNLIGLDRVSNSLLVINPSTAAASVLAAVPTTVGGDGGVTVLNGVGYLDTAGPGATAPGSNLLYSFDLFNGSPTLIGSFSPTISDSGIIGLAVTVPEPMSAIAIFAIAGSLQRNRRRGTAAV